jgi:hypothetical protein
MKAGAPDVSKDRSSFIIHHSRDSFQPLDHFLQRHAVGADGDGIGGGGQRADGSGGVFTIATLLRGQDLFQRNGLALRLQVK